MYYFYTASNLPTIYQVNSQLSSTMTWSTTALGGAVNTIIMIFATLAKFAYIPTTCNNNTSHLTHWHLVGHSCSPTFLYHYCGAQQHWEIPRINCPILYCSHCHSSISNYAFRMHGWGLHCWKVTDISCELVMRMVLSLIDKLKWIWMENT